jgi:hypothetical protein
MLEINELNSVYISKKNKNVRVYFCTKDEAYYINKCKNILGKVWLIKFPEFEIVSCTIKETKKGNRKYTGKDKKLLGILQKFVEENEYLLWGFWNTELEKSDWTKIANKFVKVN